MQNLLENFTKEQVQTQLISACGKIFELTSIVELKDGNTLRLNFADGQDYLLQIHYELGLCFLYQIDHMKFVLRGTLIEAEKIGAITNIFEVVGDGNFGLALKSAEKVFIHGKPKKITL